MEEEFGTPRRSAGVRRRRVLKGREGGAEAGFSYPTEYSPRGLLSLTNLDLSLLPDVNKDETITLSAVSINTKTKLKLKMCILYSDNYHEMPKQFTIVAIR